MKIGSKIKNFKAEMTGNNEFSLSDYQGKNVVIYFYPRDNTPGCTSEGEDFRDNYKYFQKKNTVIFGVSKDSIKSHKNFKEKFNFPFELISDPDEKICNIFDVIKMYNFIIYIIFIIRLIISINNFSLMIINK